MEICSLSVCHLPSVRSPLLLSYLPVLLAIPSLFSPARCRSVLSGCYLHLQLSVFCYPPLFLLPVFSPLLPYGDLLSARSSACYLFRFLAILPYLLLPASALLAATPFFSCSLSTAYCSRAIYFPCHLLASVFLFSPAIWRSVRYLSICLPIISFCFCSLLLPSYPIYVFSLSVFFFPSAILPARSSSYSLSCSLLLDVDLPFLTYSLSCYLLSVIRCFLQLSPSPFLLL
jgi:hypothetical protein